MCLGWGELSKLSPLEKGRTIGWMRLIMNGKRGDILDIHE